MRVAVMNAPGDMRVEDRPEPIILEPTDAIIRLAASCICGSDLWPYRGVEKLNGPRPMGHEYAGIVEEVGSEVATIKSGQFVVRSLFASDNTCQICRAGYHPPASAVRPPHPAAPKPSGCASRWPTAPWSPPPTCRGRPAPRPARRLRRAGHRVVRRRRRPGGTGQAGRRRR